MRTQHLSAALLVVVMTSAVSAENCAPPPGGLVSWWRAEGDGIDAWSTHQGTLLNGASFGPGMVGQAFLLDGSDDYVAVPHDPALDISGDITIDAWIRPTALGDQRVIVSKRSFDNQNMNYVFFLESDGRLNFTSRSGGGFNTVQSAGAVAVGPWTFVAVTISGTTLTFYINGTAEAPVSFTAARPSNTGRVTIGIVEIDPLLIPPLGLAAPFAGALDEIEISARAASPAELLAIYDAGSTGKCRQSVGVNRSPWGALKRLYR